jgi:hypothetical protein
MNESIPPPIEEFKTVPDLAGTTELRSEDAQGQSSGEKEAAAVAAGTLEDESKKAEHGRIERLRNHVNMAALGGVWLLFFLFTSATLIVALHYMMPTKWCWLTDGQLTAMTTFLTSGAISGAAVRYMTTRIA